MADVRHSVWVVGSFTVGYLALATLAAGQRGNWEFVLYIGVVLVLMGVVFVVHRRVNLSPGLLWALSLWGLAHMAGGLCPVPAGWPIQGEQPVLYSLWLIPDRLKYDQIVHAFGFGTTTWVCWHCMRAAMGGAATQIRPTSGLMVLACAAGMGFGALNEVVEFAATLLVPETNVGGYLNTGWDLVANLVGAILATALIVVLDRRRGAGPFLPRRGKIPQRAE